MARIGVTYQDIANAASQLLGQGKSPTIELIRHFLGTGSATTIANHLRKWRADQDGSSSLARAENLPEEMITMMKGLWERLNYHAEEKVMAIDVKYQQHVAELECDVQKYKNNNQRWQQMFNQWSQEKEKLAAHVVTLEQGIELLQQDKLGLQARLDANHEQLQEKQLRIDELHKLHSQVQANLEHFREATREQRLVEQAQFEQQKQELMNEVKLLKEQGYKARENLQTLQQNLQALQQVHQTLENNHDKMAANFDKQEMKITSLEKEKSEHQQASQHWQQQYQALSKNLEAKNNQIIESTADIKIATKQIKDLEKIIKDLEDQHKILGQEKWLLAQEKSQLEGQLKQVLKLKSS